MDLFNIIKLYQDDIDKAKWERTVIDAAQNTRTHKKTFRGTNNREVIGNIKTIAKKFNEDRAMQQTLDTLDNLIISYTVENNMSMNNILSGNITDSGKPKYLQELLTGEVATSEFSRERKRKVARGAKEDDPQLWQQLIDELKIEVEFEKQLKSALRNSDSLKEFLKLYPNMPRAKQLYQKERLGHYGKGESRKKKQDSPVRRRIEISPDPEKVTLVTLHLANSHTGAEVRNIKILLPFQASRRDSYYRNDVTIIFLCNRDLVDSRNLKSLYFSNNYIDDASKWLYSLIQQIYKNNIETLNLSEGLGDS